VSTRRRAWLPGWPRRQVVTPFPCRRQIGEATERLTRLEGELTAAQDANFNASHVLSAVDRGARALNHSLQDLERRLHALKTSNFLGEPCRRAGPGRRGRSWGSDSAPATPRRLRQHPPVPRGVTGGRAPGGRLHPRRAQPRQRLGGHPAPHRAAPGQPAGQLQSPKCGQPAGADGPGGTGAGTEPAPAQREGGTRGGERGDGPQSRPEPTMPCRSAVRRATFPVPRAPAGELGAGTRTGHGAAGV